MNVSEQLLSILKSEGVSQIFGVAGDALNPLVDAIARQDQIKWIKVNHEGNASFAAFAQGELGNNFGVCASTVGPGALHLVNGLYNAKKERSPVIAITGQIPVENIGTNYHQEVDLKKVFDDICAYQGIIRSAEEAPKVILRAIRIAINEGAVCRIELPDDIAMQDAVNEELVHPVFRSKSLIVPDEPTLKSAIEVLNKAEKITILGGVGCRQVKEEVLQLSQKLKAPIAHTLKSSDIFDHSTVNVVGLSGLIGNPSAYKAIMNCDVLLMLGTDFPYQDFLPHDTKTIQIDRDTSAIGNRTAVHLGIQGDLEAVMPELVKSSVIKQDTGFLDPLNHEFKKWKEEKEREGSIERNIDPMHPQIIAKQLSDRAASDAIFVIDTGTAAIWSSNNMNFHSDRRIIGSFNHGSMAVGLPAAIGAQALFPEREVWALVGDGAFSMAMQDLPTAVEYELPIKVIIFNNSELGFVKIEMEEAGLAPNFDALSLKNIDFAAYAELCGAKGIKVTNAEEAVDALNVAKHHMGPVVIDAIVNSSELSLPPKIGFEEIKGFGTAKAKELYGALKGDKKQWENFKAEIETFFN